MKNHVKRFAILIAFTASFLFLAGIDSLRGQDIIIKNDKTEIQAKVMEIGEYTIKYKLFNHLDGPVRLLNKSEIFMIIYENGARETFNVSELSQTPAQIPTQTQYQKQSKPQESISQKPASEESEFSHSGFCFGGKAGFYIPFDQKISEIYGGGFMGGLLIGYWAYRWGFEIDWRYYSKAGDPYTYGQVDEASARLTISPLTLTTYYDVYKMGNLETYVGLGLGACFIEEELSMSAFGSTQSGSINLTAFEFHSTGGIRFAPFYVELSFLSISTSYDVGFGGFLISGGIFF